MKQFQRILFMLVLPLSLSVQADNHLPRVYLDVPFWPTDYITSEADFVDYVRDRDNADIHVLGIVFGDPRHHYLRGLRGSA